MEYVIEGKKPDIDPTAIIAPTAVISGAVTIGPRAHISFGAVILGDDSPVTIGEQTVIRENVVIRASEQHPVRVGDYVLIGARSALDKAFYGRVKPWLKHTLYFCWFY